MSTDAWYVSFKKISYKWSCVYVFLTVQQYSTFNAGHKFRFAVNTKEYIIRKNYRKDEEANYRLLRIFALYAFVLRIAIAISNYKYLPSFVQRFHFSSFLKSMGWRKIWFANGFAAYTVWWLIVLYQFLEYIFLERLCRLLQSLQPAKQVKFS